MDEGIKKAIEDHQFINSQQAWLGNKRWASLEIIFHTETDRTCNLSIGRYLSDGRKEIPQVIHSYTPGGAVTRHLLP